LLGWWKAIVVNSSTPIKRKLMEAPKALLGYLGLVDSVMITGDVQFKFLNDWEEKYPSESMLLVISVGGSAIEYPEGLIILRKFELVLTPVLCFTLVEDGDIQDNQRDFVENIKKEFTAVKVR
jgi:hypothetical protein